MTNSDLREIAKEAMSMDFRWWTAIGSNSYVVDQANPEFKGVRVAEPDPSEVGWIDDGSKRLHEVPALDGGAGFDQDGL